MSAESVIVSLTNKLIIAFLMLWLFAFSLLIFIPSYSLLKDIKKPVNVGENQALPNFEVSPPKLNEPLPTITIPQFDEKADQNQQDKQKAIFSLQAAVYKDQVAAYTQRVNAYTQQVTAYAQQVTAYTHQLEAYKTSIGLSTNPSTATYTAVVKDVLQPLLGNFFTGLSVFLIALIGGKAVIDYFSAKHK